MCGDTKLANNVGLRTSQTQVRAQIIINTTMVNVCQQRTSILEVTKQFFIEAMEKTLHESKEQKRRITEQCEAYIAKTIEDNVNQDYSVKDKIMKLLSSTQERMDAEQDRCRIEMMKLRDEFEHATEELKSKVAWDQENYGHLKFIV